MAVENPENPTRNADHFRKTMDFPLDFHQAAYPQRGARHVHRAEVVPRPRPRPRPARPAPCTWRCRAARWKADPWESCDVSPFSPEKIMDFGPLL